MNWVRSALIEPKEEERSFMNKIKYKIRRIAALWLMAVTFLTSINLPGTGVQEVYAKYASGTTTGKRAAWTGGPNSVTEGNGYPGENKWLLRFNTDSTSGTNYDYAYSEGGTISNVHYDGYVLRKAGVSLTAKLDFSNIEYMEFDLTRHSSDKGDGVFFSAISDTMYTSYIQPASAGNSAASSATLKKKMKEETNTTIYKTATKGVKETKTYDCASITGSHYFTIMNYSNGDGAAPLMQISEIRVYGPVTTYSDCHVTSASMTGTDTIDYGKTTTFSAVPTGGKYDPAHVKYQWYDNGNGSTHLMSGKTGSSITITGNENSAGHTYYCQVYADNDSAGVNTSGGWCSRKLKVNAPSFTANLPSTISMGLNGTATMTIAGSNYGSVAWQKSTDDGSTWNSAGSGTSIKITDSNGDQNKVKYRAVLKGGSEVTSNVCTVSVASPSFTAQPKNVTVNEGGTATFSVTASNASSIKWQESKNNGSTWTDITGATGSTLILENVSMDMNNRRYRAIASSGVGSTTSSVATLTVSEIRPQIITQPQDLSVIEGRSLSFAVNAKYYKSIKWQVSKDGGMTWNDIAGATDPTYIQNDVKLTQNGERYRAVVKNADLTTTSREALLTVSEKTFIGFYVEYPSSEVDYKSTIKVSDVFAIFRYDNGDASFCKNAEGLTFAGGMKELYMGTLGPQTVKCYYEGVREPQSFTVNVVDKSAPSIQEINISWEDEEFDGTNLSNDPEKRLVISADVTDNSEGIITYAWSKDGEEIESDGNILVIDGNDGNGTYYLKVTDETGNASGRYININAWDFVAPQINGFETTPSTAWAAYRNISVDASDDNALAALAYSYDEGKSYLSGSSFLVDRNGVFKVIVRDMAGNTAEGEIEINNIDRDAPEITSIERFEEDGDVYVMIAGEDELSTVTYGYRLPSGDVSWQETGKFLIETNEERDKGGRTFYVRDEAGNTAGTKIYINSEYINLPDLVSQLYSTMYQNPSDTWTDGDSGVKLGFVLGNNDNIFDKYTWSNEGEETKNQSTQVHDNGDYSATLYTTDGNGRKDKIAATLSYNVVNIDKTAPEIEVNKEEGKLLVEAFDGDSGIDKVYVEGGEYEKETLICVSGGNEKEKCYAEALVNGEYTLRATDKVGNEAKKTFVVTDERSVSSDDIPGMITISPEDGEDDDDEEDETDEFGFHRRGRWVNGYTNKNIIIRINVPGWFKSMLADKPFSWDDGMTWTRIPYIIVKENGIYHLLIKLRNGTIIRCPDIVINCIDRQAPDLMVTSYGMKIFIYAKDEKCGLAKVMMKDPDGQVSRVEGTVNEDGGFEAQVTVTKEGRYVITAIDGLGNERSKETTVKAEPGENKPKDTKDDSSSDPDDGDSGSTDPADVDDPDAIDGDGLSSIKYGDGTLLIDVGDGSFEFTGGQIRPKVKLKYIYTTATGKKRTRRLKENRDYTLTYRNNINVGKARMKITGIGDFSGSINKTFEIVPRNMKRVRIKGLKDIVYGTEPSKLHPTLKDRGRIMTEGKDYTVSADSVQGMTFLGKKYQKISLTVNATPSGNYAGSKSSVIKIYRRSLTNPIAVKVDAKDIKLGEKPQLSVKYSGIELTEGEDYTVTYKRSDREGTAKAYITGQGNYYGRKTVKFKVIR